MKQKRWTFSGIKRYYPTTTWKAWETIHKGGRHYQKEPWAVVGGTQWWITGR